jgi:outer membrane receptor protein involved in Fe transport
VAAPSLTRGTLKTMSADPSAANFNHQEGLWLLDFNYSWQITAAFGINASVRNLFAEEPPITTGGNRAFFNRNRRTYRLQFTHSFSN